MSITASLASPDEETIIEAKHDGSSPQDTGSNKPASSFAWAMTLFGTAVGAGILFLPINAGSFGFWPLLVATIIIGPLVFFSHRTYSRIVSTAPTKGMDVLEVVTHFVGRKRGIVTAVMYWFSIFPIVLIYGVSITNTADSFLVNQLGFAPMDRWLLSVICVGIMTLGYAFGRKVVMWLSNILVYPLIISLAVVSFYLIPRWDIQSFMAYESDVSLLSALFLIFPVLIFSFSYMAAVSQLALDMEKEGNPRPDRKVSKIVLYTTIMLTGFTMFFVWSCALALGAGGMDEALEQNIPILSYFANVTHTPFMAFMAPIVAICAIVTSFFGHMMGAEEGTKYLFKIILPEKTSKRLSEKAMSYAIYIFVFIMTTMVAIFNPSIMDLISVVGGIFITFLVYVLPMLFFRFVPSAKKFAKRPETIVVFCVGCIVIATTLLEMI